MSSVREIPGDTVPFVPWKLSEIQTKMENSPSIEPSQEAKKLLDNIGVYYNASNVCEISVQAKEH